MANKPKVAPVKTADLSGDALSYAVALATGTADKKFREAEDGSVKAVVSFEPWRNWYHGGPLFEQYGPTFQVRGLPNGAREFYAVLPGTALLVGAWGPNHLTALSRAVVLAELGDVVDVPASLLNSHADQLAKEKNDEQGHLPLGDSSPASPAPSAPVATPEPTKPAKEESAKPAAEKPANKVPDKPAPQGKHAQAMKDHGKPQQGKGGK